MDKKEYLAQILGSVEKADAFLEKTGLKQKVLKEAEVESKEKTEEKVEVVPPVAPPEVPVVVPPIEPTLTLEGVLKALDVEGLNAFVAQAKEDHEKIPVLEELVKQLQGSQDEKLAEKLTPPAARFTWSQENRASQAEDNIVSAKEKEKNQPGVPEGYWLSEATKTEPVKVE